MDHEHHQPPAQGNNDGSRAKIAFAVLAAVAAFFLFTEHRAHLLGFLPFLIFLACPLMHSFHHGSNGGHDTHGADENRRTPPGPANKES